MNLRPEIKEFVKKTVLLTVVLSLFINLLSLYLGAWAGTLGSTVASADLASPNDANFKKTWVPYLAGTAVAISMNIGTNKVVRSNTPVRLYTEVMPLGTILASQSTGRNTVITSEMGNINAYLNVLKTDVHALLGSATDRETMLNDYIDQLKDLYTRSTEHATQLTAQANDLQATITKTVAAEDAAKQDLSTAYGNLDYDKTESTIDAYLEAKRQETVAHTYLIFLGKFISSYGLLNDYNKKLMSTLITNREALIKNVTVVMPDSGTELMSGLQLIQTESQYKASKQ